jgi:hypothetical protein
MTPTRRLLAILGATGLTLLAAGCSHLEQSEAGAILGVVQYPNGASAVHAGVHLAGETDLVFTGPTGAFTLPVSGSPGDTVVVTASDAYDGRAHGVINSGSSRVLLRKSAVGTVIVLSGQVPI